MRSASSRHPLVQEPTWFTGFHARLSDDVTTNGIPLDLGQSAPQSPPNAVPGSASETQHNDAQPLEFDLSESQLEDLMASFSTNLH